MTRYVVVGAVAPGGDVGAVRLLPRTRMSMSAAWIMRASQVLLRSQLSSEGFLLSAVSWLVEYQNTELCHVHIYIFNHSHAYTISISHVHRYMCMTYI